jgi:hypothetical protein
MRWCWVTTFTDTAVRRPLLLLTVAVLVALGAWRLSRPTAEPAPAIDPVQLPAVAEASVAATERRPEGAVWAMTFVRARPGQRERMERYLKANWLAVDELAKQQGHLTDYRLLRADRDLKETWDFAVILEYANARAMADFVPAYVALVRGRPRVRVEGLDFGDLGEIVQQKIVAPVDTDPAHAAPALPAPSP